MTVIYSLFPVVEDLVFCWVTPETCIVEVALHKRRITYIKMVDSRYLYREQRGATGEKQVHFQAPVC